MKTENVKADSSDTDLVDGSLPEPVPKVRRWMGSRDKCDICKCDITKKKFIDGATVHGPWALMCWTCHRTYGRGLGPGKGQLYDVDGTKLKG